MGPLFSRLGNQLDISEHRRSIRNGGMGSDDPSARHTSRDHIGVEHGLEDDNTEVRMVNGTMAPTSERGETHSNEVFVIDSLGVHAIISQKRSRTHILKFSTALMRG